MNEKQNLRIKDGLVVGIDEQFFKPEDFYHLANEKLSKGLGPCTWEEFAEEANRLLKERGVRVSGHIGEDNNWVMETELYSSDTHQALLVCIEELPKKECEHEPLEYASGVVRVDSGVCKHCGIKLKAKWEVAE